MENSEVTLYSVSEQINDLSFLINLLLKREEHDSRMQRKGTEKIMALIDDVLAEIKVLSTDLTNFNTDFDAVVAMFKGEIIPSNLQPALDALTALQAQVDATDAKAKALLPPVVPPAGP